MNESQSRTVKVLGFVLGSIGFISALLSFAITTNYLQSAPVVPNPSAGVVYSVEVRGETIYLGKRDYTIQTWMFPCSCLLTMLGVSLITWAQNKNR